MPGAQEQRLIQALQGAEPGAVNAHANEWRDCGQMLAEVAQQLAGAKLPVHEGETGALTADAMNAAFVKSATAMGKRAAQLRLGHGALADASHALDTVRAAHEALGPEGSAPSYTPPDDPGSEAGIKQHNQYLSAVSDYQAAQAHREEVSRQQNEHLTKVFAQSTETMKQIHGEPDPPPPPPAYGPGAATGGGGAYAPASPGHASGTSHTTAAGAHLGTVVGHAAHPGGAGGTKVDYTPVAGHNPGGSGGEPPPSYLVPTSDAGGGSGFGLGDGVAGVAGGAAAGLIGAKLTNALRGGGLLGGGSAGVSGRSMSASAVRGIGATARSGGAGTLGRSAAAAEESAAGRSNATGRAGAGATGRSGSPGRSGGRAGGRGGSGAAGRGGRGKDEKKGKQGELFDVGEDWVGDDEAAPGVLD